MAKKEYIEKKDLKKIIKANAWTNPAVPNAVNMIIDRTPAADVAEVVRCKDCEYYTREMIGDSLECTCNCFSGMINISPDSYCSYGEKAVQK